MCLLGLFAAHCISWTVIEKHKTVRWLQEHEHPISETNRGGIIYNPQLINYVQCIEMRRQKPNPN